MTLPEGVELDLDGQPYRVSAVLGAWRVTPCCYSYATGIDEGIVCKTCYAPVDDDGPARVEA